MWGVCRNGIWSTPLMIAQLNLLLLLLLCYEGESQWSPAQPGSSKAHIEISLSNHPGRVYSGAGPGLVVMQISAVNALTGEQVGRFSLEQSTDSIFFRIDSAGYIRTSADINFSLGKEFGLMVAGYSGDIVGYKYVQIVVSEENLFPPQFEKDSYRFQIYGRDVGETIGRVRVFDKDLETYNRDVILQPLVNTMVESLDYVSLSQQGELTLEKIVPDSYAALDFAIEAINTGCPRKNARALVHVDILKIKQPDIFCFWTTKNSTTLCWKNPMPDRQFPGYHVLFKQDDQDEWNVLMPWIEGHQETCYTAEGTKLDSSYRFTVRIAGNREVDLDQVGELHFNKSAIGYSQECVDESFSVCNYRDPCYGHGTCLSDPRGIPSAYTCFCDKGWVGENCTFRDECPFLPCQNGGTCEYLGHTSFRCYCPEGYIGDVCEHYNHCLTSPNPCQNGAECSMHNNGSFSCNCLIGFSGDFCENLDPCAGSNCIVDHGQCMRLSDSEYDCACYPGYYGKACELTDWCILNNQPCRNQGTCLSTSNSFKCLCTDGYIGDLCETPDMCFLQPCVNGNCSLNPATKSYLCTCFDGFEGNECQRRIDPCEDVNCNHGVCESDSELIARCKCDYGYMGPDCLNFDPCSSAPCRSEGQCTRVDDESYRCTCVPGWVGKNCQAYNPCVVIPPHCSSLETCILHPESEWPSENVVKYTCLDIVIETEDPTDELSNLTNDPSQVTSQIFENVTRKLLEIFDTALEDPQVAEKSVQVISNLANVNVSVSEDTGHLSKQLRGFLDNYTLYADSSASDTQVNISTTGIQLKSVVVSKSGNHEEAFTFSPGGLGDENETRILIQLPSAVLDRESDMDETRLRFVAYDRSQLFVPDGGFWEDYIQDGLLGRQKVISASVGTEPIANLSSPVVIHLVKIRDDVNHTCAYWDDTANTWSDEGVTLVSENDTVVICHSDHLTNFAVLMAPTTEALPSGHAQALEAITWAGCAISMACLFLTILTYGLFRCLYGEKSGKTLLNLCSALLFLNIMFLVGTLDVSGFSRSTCVAVAMCVHYSLLASLMWMLVEAVDMYQALVRVFNKYENYYLIKRCIAAWGLPVVVVAITAAIDTSNYFTENRSTKVCLMTAANTPAYHITLLAPGCLIVLVNTVVFILVTRVILKPKFQHHKSNKEASSTVTIAQVRGAFMVMILLGITWLFGPLAIEDARLVFSYIFCICNSLQGCLIFFFRCLLNPEAQLAWKQLFTTGTLKRRRGPIRSADTDTSSKTFGGTNPKFGVQVDTKKGKVKGDGDDIGDGVGWKSAGKNNKDQRDSVTTLYTIANIGSLADRGRKSVLPCKGPKAYHAHPHQLHSTNAWHPNLNGLPRESPAGMVVTVPSGDAKDHLSDNADSPSGSVDSKFIEPKDTGESITQF